ncbi:MAG TPA: ABC transporter permease [Bryobacteraceae bacterium]|jgi:osmoprotectant transport system permease protein|nr:ABC transporter permease [Bryobacteraceae bacterium]
MPPELLPRALEHLEMVAITILVASAVGIPAAALLAHRPSGARWALWFANIGQTVPSLALFGFLIPIHYIGGIGQHTAIEAMCLYALLPILRNALTGLTGVDPAVRESAIAMGMTSSQILRQVELPLAAPSIMAGVRIATVSTIGTATIAAAIGGGGLGTFIFRGIAMVDSHTILAGAVPAAILAIAADEVLEWIERRLAPA